MSKNTYYFIITGFFSLLSIIINFAYINGEMPQTLSENKTINKINELTPFYIATSLECLASEEIKTDPYIVFEDKCIEKGTMKGIGKIVNEETFLNTVIENKTIFGQGNGTISTEDNQSSIKWSSYDANLVKGGYLGYRGIIYFNSTIDDKFAFLNNTVGIYESDSNTVRSIWLWE